MNASTPSPGLCESCEHAHVITSARGSTFYRCRVHDRDRAWPKYPPLPVIACPHHRVRRDGDR